MNGFLIKEHGGPEMLVWTSLPDPEPGPGEVLLKVAAVGINHLDLWVRRGVQGHRFPLPMVPGSDITGTVVKAGPGVEAPSPQTRFMVSPGYSCGRCRQCLKGEQQHCHDYGIFGESCDGGYAELVVVPAMNLLPVPEHLSFAEAASMPLTFLTAWHMLVARARVEPGQWVLIHAAASGVSSAAIQIARLFGARVIATASTETKLDHARALGADVLVNYRTDDWVQKVRAETGRRGVEIVVDHVGAATFKGNLACLARGGTLVFCGATDGAQVQLDLRPVFFKGLSILGSTMGTLGEMAAVAELMAAGKLVPNPLTTFPLKEAARAHALLESRSVVGKLVLEA
jgi:NADPH:quinone reductase-like Zn-dependent oxidoreductase